MVELPQAARRASGSLTGSAVQSLPRIVKSGTHVRADSSLARVQRIRSDSEKTAWRSAHNNNRIGDRIESTVASENDNFSGFMWFCADVAIRLTWQ